MTREARMMSGIILITVPTIQYGGYFLLMSLTNKASGYMDNPLRQNFFRAGACPRRGDRDSFSDLPGAGRRCRSPRVSTLACKNRCAAGRNSDFVRFLFLGARTRRYASEPSRLSHIRGRARPRGRGRHPRGWIVAVPATELGAPQFC